MKKQGILIFGILALINIKPAKSQSVKLNLGEIFQSDQQSYKKNPIYPILEEVEYKGKTHTEVQFQDPNIKEIDLTLLFDSTGAFQNISYTALIQYGQSFDPKVFFNLCGLSNDFIITKQALNGKYDLETSNVIFPKEKIKIFYFVQDKGDILRYQCNIFRAKEDEINSASKLKTESSKVLSFSSQSLKNPDEYVTFQGLRLGKRYTDSGVSEILEPYNMSVLDGNLVYSGKGTIVGFPAQIIFYFNDLVFYRGIYQLDQDYVNDNTYNEDFEKLEKLLGEKYGSPKNNLDIWSKDLFKSDAKRIGFAISAGHLKRVRVWEVDGIQIKLMIIGENYEIDTYLGYTSMSIADEIKKETDASLLNEL